MAQREAFFRRKFVTTFYIDFQCFLDHFIEKLNLYFKKNKENVYAFNPWFSL